MIVVKKKNEKQFIVKVEEEGTAKDYSVTLYDDYYQKLTGGRITKEELIRKSFKFLLKREPRDSILSKFNLKIISNYFPEYEKVIKSK
ncbi:unnamed protein product [marine sediment metagenome]|uniref:Uncharacterized protein n=1 Tax=marine sediment metagenome TaxID=412755 RepID=X1D5M2_9ZZZZ